MENKLTGARTELSATVVARDYAESRRIGTLPSICARSSFVACETRRSLAGARSVIYVSLLASALLAACAVSANAQVTVDHSSTVQQTLISGSNGSFTLSPLSFTVSTNANLLVVGVSLNNNGNTGSSVTGITYGSQSFSATNSFSAEPGNGFRVEFWYLISPTAGTNNITVTVNKAGGNGNKLGVQFGAISFFSVDTTTPASPIRGFTSAFSSTGSSTAASVTAASGNGEVVLDLLATLGGLTATPGSGQTQRWTQSSTGSPTTQNVLGASSSSSAGTSTVTMSETLSAGSNWLLGAISVRPKQADLSITKTASASSVLQNSNFTYTLTVTNNGPRTATGVLIVDTLPSQVTYVSATYTVSSPAASGSCSQTLGVVTCSGISMNSGATATVTITVTANTPSQPTNSATVSLGSPLDPDLSNNSASVTITITYPTAAKVNSFAASSGPGGALVTWRSAGEIRNLGYNVYRDVAGEKTKLNASLIAGSALLMRESLEQHGAKVYSFIDRHPIPGALYWLEDVDLSGQTTMRGPITPDGSLAGPGAGMATSRTVAVSGRVQASTVMPVAPTAAAHVREATVHPAITPSLNRLGFALAAKPAVKILVDHEGWYHVTQPQLVAAGLNPNANAGLLHLYAEGVEQPIRVVGSGATFGASSAIEFYGTAIDTPFSGQRVYWLTSGRGPGLRIADAMSAGTAGPQVQTFTQTLDLKLRTTYFAALLRDDTDNFFGPLVSSTGDAEAIPVANLAAGNAQLSVTLQGVTQGQQHDVTVMLNGSTLGDISFFGQQEGSATFDLPSGIVSNGANTVTLTAQQGSSDISLVDTISLSFPHTFTAENDSLKFTADAGDSVTVGGFVQAPSRLIDITDPLHPLQLQYSVSSSGGVYSLQTVVPWSSSGTHTLLAISDEQLGMPVAIVPHSPTNLHANQLGGEYVIVTTPQFGPAFQPLMALHKSEGMSVAMASINDIYDEFNFGEPSPYAVKAFLQTVSSTWKNAPKYLVLGGDASVDPRNYLGFGYFDFVPTRIVPTAMLKTASDDWFSDFNGQGMASIATGRLAARTLGDAQVMVGKIVAYSSGGQTGWNTHSLTVADQNDPGLSFTSAAQSIEAVLPASITNTEVFAGTLGISTARQTLLDNLNSGQLLVNYTGHGSVQVWSGSDLFDDTAAASLTNGNKLPLFVAMNCLNGFFHDVYTQSLAEALMLAPNGGAVAVWASSGLTQPGPQFQMDKSFVHGLLAQGTAIGDAALTAKGTISDLDVRRTFILFGDPAMKLSAPVSGATNILRPSPVQMQLKKLQ